MPQSKLNEINRIRNPAFAAGRDRPLSWTWESLAGAPHWTFDGQCALGDGRVVVLRTQDERSAGQWSQSFRCRSRHAYRIELLASCRVDDDGPGGLSLHVRPRDSDGVVLEDACRGGPWRSRRPAWWRVRYRTPAGARRLEIAVRLENARGLAELHRVRAVPMDYVACESHPVSVPPWPFVYPRPCTVRTIQVVDQPDRAECLGRMLRARFGRAAVRTQPQLRPGLAQPDADALLVGPSVPVPATLTWPALLKWARGRILIVSLPFFERLLNRRGGPCVSIREYVQYDDTLGVRIDHANFVTNGFSLHDVLEWSTWDPATGRFSQRQLIRGPALRRFMADESVLCVLSSDTNMDSTSGRPTCLYREAPHGGLLVMDLDPLLSPMTNEATAHPCLQILLNALGSDTVSIGQYAEPQAAQPARNEHLTSLSRQVPGMNLTRVPGFVPNARRGPALMEPVITVGRGADETGVFALPLLLVRTGLDEDARDGFDGAMTWIKAFGRKQPCVPGYAPFLLQSRRVVWLPRAGRVPADQLGRLGLFRPGSLVIDVQTTSRNVIRVMAPTREAPYDRYFDWLLELDRALRFGRMFGWLPAPGASLHDRDACGWRGDQAPLYVSDDPASFTPIEGGDRVRRLCIEVPDDRDPCAGNGILHTEYIALLLEWIAGLEIGLVAVNRGPVHRWLSFPADTLSALTGPAWCIEPAGRPRPLSDLDRHRPGRARLLLPPGGTLLIQHGPPDLFGLPRGRVGP